MNSLLKVHSLLFAFTLVSVAAPAFAITRIGNSKALQVASCTCQGKVFPDRLCPMIRCTDETASSSGKQVSETASSPTNPSVLVARDWFGWERDPKSKRTSA
jgi:hypothetical protein